MIDVNEYWDYLIEQGIATEQELRLVTDINGYSVETLDDVLYARTGYRSYEQYTGEADDDEADEADETSDDE